MSYQEQIDQIKQQIESSVKALDKLSFELSNSVNKPEQSQENSRANALAGYLALGSDIKDDALLNMILQSAMYVVGAGGAGLTLLDSETNTLVFKAAIGDGAEGIVGFEVPLEGSQHGLAFATGEIQSSTPLNTDIESKAKTQFKNVLVAPLFVNADGVGTISAVNKNNGEHFTSDDMAAYKHFADLAAMVIRQRQREEILKDLLGGKGNTPDELKGITFNDESKQLMSIIQDVMNIAQHQEDMLPLCKKLTELLSSMSMKNHWS